MITLFTIGFTKKSAEKFFNLLRGNNVKQLVDVRISNSSQLAGFAKGICHIPYTHIVDFAPTKELLDKWHKGDVSWAEYEKIYTNMLNGRDILRHYGVKKFDRACFLCSEDTPENCHRRLLAEYLKKHSKEDVKIVHLI